MNKKKHHKIWIFFLLLTSSFLSPMLTACSDDNNKQEQDMGDEDEFSVEDRKNMKQMNAIWTVLNVLADQDSLTEDFAQKKYIPTYGKVLDEAAPYTRSIKADSLEESIEKLKQIVGEWDFAEPTNDGYSIQLKYPTPQGDKVFGKLTFHQDGKKMLTAHIDVEIPSIPTLQRINFLPKEAWDNNAGATTPYQLGELVYYKGFDGGKCRGYYICVRINSGPEDGVLLHLDENFNTTFGRWMDNGDDYDFRDHGGWKPWLSSYKEDVMSYLKFLYEWSYLLDIDIEYLKKHHPSEVKSICPSGFHTDGYVYKGNKPAAIVTQAYFGSFHFWSMYYYRHVNYYVLPQNNRYGSGGKEDYVEYIKYKHWRKLYDNHSLYTMSALHFESNTIAGVMPIYDPADAE